MDTFGATTDPTIVLMHGAGDTRLAWDDAFCERLADAGRRVVRYDLADGPDLDALVRQALDRLDALGAAHLVGLSLGGMVAQRVAIEQPERVSTLTLIATTAGGDRPDDWFGAPWRPHLGEITAPTLVIHGADDDMFALPHAHTLAREIDGAALLVLPETGHEYPPRRHWDTVIDAIVAHTG